MNRKRSVIAICACPCKAEFLQPHKNRLYASKKCFLAMRRARRQMKPKTPTLKPKRLCACNCGTWFIRQHNSQKYATAQHRLRATGRRKYAKHRRWYRAWHLARYRKDPAKYCASVNKYRRDNPEKIRAATLKKLRRKRREKIERIWTSMIHQLETKRADKE